VKPQDKKEVVEALRKRLESASIILVAEPRGLTVAQVTQLRQQMRSSQGEYKIAKNTLALRAIEATDYAAVAPQLKGQTALVFGYGDPVALTKALVKYASDNSEKLSVRGAVLDGALLGGEDVSALAKLGSKEQLRAQLLGLLSTPASQLVRVLNASPAALARVLQARVTAGGGPEAQSSPVEDVQTVEAP
jgi:large subunit ribosomal protein L10